MMCVLKNISKLDKHRERKWHRERYRNASSLKVSWVSCFRTCKYSSNPFTKSDHPTYFQSVSNHSWSSCTCLLDHPPPHLSVHSNRTFMVLLRIWHNLGPVLLAMQISRIMEWFGLEETFKCYPV